MKLFGGKTREPLRVDVLGAGPTGLLAAHAAESLGHTVSVYSAPDKYGMPAKSELHGCQYLHQYIPGLGLNETGRPVAYHLNGDTEDYRRKVYGDNWQGQVSPDEFGEEKDHLAWDLREAYEALWQRWGYRVRPLSVDPMLAQTISERIKRYPGRVVLCTIPATALCLDEEHKFPAQQVWAMGSTREDFATSRTLPYYAPDFTVQCNGTRYTGWYRAATVFGQSTLEWPMGPKPPVHGVARVSKPLSTDCTCHQVPGWHRLGRYGRWTKGVLAHTAYFDTLALLG